jgi:hypothetical protein
MSQSLQLEKMLKGCLKQYICARWRALEEIEGTDESECSRYYAYIMSTEKVTKPAEGEKKQPIKHLFTVNAECQQYLRWIVDQIILELSQFDKPITDEGFKVAMQGTDILAWMVPRYPKIVINQREVNYGELSKFRCIILNQQLVTSDQSHIVMDKVDRLLNDIAHVCGSILKYNKLTVNGKLLSGILCTFGLDQCHLEEMKSDLREPKKKAQKAVV